MEKVTFDGTEESILTSHGAKDVYLGDVINDIPLCPHCGEWSYYTTKEAEINGGYTACPFCEKLMYMEDFFENK